MSYRSTLPMAKNKEMLKFYTEAVEILKNYKSAIEEFLAESTEEDIASMSAFERLSYYKYKYQLHEVSGKIHAQENNLQVYQDRIELMMPEFERISAEANTEFDKTVEEAIAIGRANMNSRYAATISMILQGWQSMKDEKLDGTTKQELKNETYKSLKTQIQAVKDDVSKSKLKKA